MILVTSCHFTNMIIRRIMNITYKRERKRKRNIANTRTYPLLLFPD